MTYRRIEDHPYPYELALKSGGDVVVDSGRLADALAHAGQPEGRFAHDGAGGDAVWLLGADDTLTLIEDHHVAETAQADFDELLDGTGPLSHQVGDAYNPAVAVEQHRAWTAAIRAAMG